MGFYRPFGRSQHSTHLLVQEPARDQGEDFAFARRQSSFTQAQLGALMILRESHSIEIGGAPIAFKSAVSSTGFSRAIDRTFSHRVDSYCDIATAGDEHDGQE
jgi:hypothetical protein